MSEAVCACACGCGQPTERPTARFLHGHNRRRPGIEPLSIKCPRCDSRVRVTVHADGSRVCGCGHGWTARPRQGPLTIERLLKRVHQTDTCWLWTGSTTEAGYGTVQLKEPRRVATVHRLMWTLTYGPIPDGVWVLHRCDTPRCCRPDHLFLGTVGDNNRDMAAKGRHWRQRHA